MIVGKIQRFLFSIIKPLCFGKRKKLSKCFPFGGIGRALVVLGGVSRHVPCKIHAMYVHNEGFSKATHAKLACITTSTLHSFHVGALSPALFFKVFYVCLCVCM